MSPPTQLPVTPPKHRSAVPTRRDLAFGLPEDRILDWHDAAGPVFTAFLNTFSIVLPVGERFFIDSVRAWRTAVTDPQLREAMTAFIGQEAMHGREHEHYNDALFARSGVARGFEKLVGKLLGFVQRRGGRTVRLSTTIALEHLTALLAERVLCDPRLSAGSEERFAALWRWHALEETEHKAVAFDVWTAVKGRGPIAYLERSAGMLGATALFWTLIIPAHLLVLNETGSLTDLKGWRGFLRYAWGDIGLIRRLIIPWAEYFNPAFHPWDRDNSEYLGEIESFAVPYRNPERAAA